MGYHLASVRATVYHQAVSCIRDALFLSQFVRYEYQVPHKPLFVPGEVGNRFDVFSGYDEKMHRRFGVYIGEGHRRFILIDDVALNLAPGDFAEDAVHSVLVFNVIAIRLWRTPLADDEAISTCVHSRPILDCFAAARNDMSIL